MCVRQAAEAQDQRKDAHVPAEAVVEDLFSDGHELVQVVPKMPLNLGVSTQVAPFHFEREDLFLAGGQCFGRFRTGSE